jgi:hypothetical protein
VLFRAGCGDEAAEVCRALDAAKCGCGCRASERASGCVSCLPPSMDRYSAARAPTAGHGGPARSEVRMSWPVLVPIRELIAGVPSPCSDHRKNKPPTLVEQDLIDIRIVRADLVRHVRNIEFDCPRQHVSKSVKSGPSCALSRPAN